jgi:hypothetical protein
MKLPRRSQRSIVFVLLWCLLGAQWAAAFHGVTHADPHGENRSSIGQGERSHHGQGLGKACLECLAFHSIDHAAPQEAQAPQASGPTFAPLSFSLPGGPRLAGPPANIRGPPQSA